MKLSLKWLLVACLLVPVALLAGRKDPLYKPRVINIPGDHPIAAIQKSVRVTFVQRGYEITKEEQGTTIGRIAKKNYWAEIAVDYTTKTAQIRYVNSEGLRYVKEGDIEYIHGHYNTWVQNIEKDLKLILGTI